MVKMIPLSIVIATIVVPMFVAARPRPKRSVRIVQIIMTIVALVWAMLCLEVYPRYVFPE